MTSVMNEVALMDIGRRFGGLLRGGEVIELIGDVGAGKTTFVKGLGEGLGVDDDIQSPSFTISRVYSARDDLELHHYDFYRLQNAGVMSYELAESVDESRTVTVVEWAETVQEVLPATRCSIKIDYTPTGHGRELTMVIPKKYSYLNEEGAPDVSRN